MQGSEILLTAGEALFLGSAIPSLFLAPSLSYKMRSSALYGPVTKVTAGKNICVSSKQGVDNMKEKGREVEDKGNKKEV